MRYQEILEACWSGYQQQGMKKKGDRQVPNCVPVEEVRTGPEMTLNDLLYTAAAKAMHQAGLEGVPMDYEEAIKKAARIYRIPYTPSELPRLLAQRAEIDRKLAMLKQGKQVAKARRKEKLAPTPAGAEEYWRTHALPTDRIKPPAKTLEETEAELAEDLKKWFKEKWVRFGPDGKIRGACARGSEGEGKPKCLPQAKAHALGKKGRASAAAKKRREDPNPERRGPARNVATKVKEQGVAEMDKSQKSQERHGDYHVGAKGTTVKPVSSKKVVKDLARDLDKAFAKEKKVKENANSKFAALIKNIQARMKKDDYQRPELMKRVAQMVQQADPTVSDAMATARELVQQHGQGPAPAQTHIGGIKIDPIKFKPGETPQGINAYWQAKGQAPIYKVQEQNDWDDADEFGMPGSEFFQDDDRLRDGDYVRDSQDGESGEIFRMSGDPSERRVRILDRDGKGWYISPERLVAVDRDDPDIMKYFGKHRQRDMDEGWKQNVAAGVLGATMALGAVNPARAEIGQKTPAQLQQSLKRAELADKYAEILIQQAKDEGRFINMDDIRVKASYLADQRLKKQKVDEKQDACYRKVKSRYKVWPSAYASGALVQCRKKGAANWGNKTKK